MSYPITRECYEKLIDELTKLKKMRPEIAERIDEARSHGDLKENAEYHAAREEQGLAEAKIAQLESKLSDANIIDTDSLPKDKVYFGSTVKIEDVDSSEVKTWKIVSEDEVSVSNRKISIKSPLAKALLGKTVGDCVSFNAPGGLKEFEILEIL